MTSHFALTDVLARLSELKTYFLPDNPVSLFVVILMILGYLRLCWWRARELRKQLVSETKSLEVLRDPDTLRRIQAELRDEDGASNFLDITSKSHSVSERTFLTICSAGKRESRLEVQELIECAGETYERQIESLKIIVSLFIIAGLFGSMFGLADSFHALSGVLRASDTATLLDKLKSAFAPSIWGVFFTMLGLYTYNSLSANAFVPFILRFKQTLIGLWIPEFYPTSPQKWANILEKSSKDLRVVLTEIAETSKAGYSEFARHVIEMTANLIELNQGLKETTKTQSSLRKLVVRLDEGLDRLAKTSVDVANFFDEMKVVSGQYKILIGTTIEEWGKHEASLRLYCNDMRELIDLETRRIETVVSTIQNSFSEHKALWSELGERFADRLLKIKDELSMLGDPLRDSSKRIDETFSNFTVYVEKNYHPYMKSLLEKLDLTVPIEEMRRSIQSQTEEISSRWNDVKGIVGALDGDGQLRITLDSTDRRHQAVVTAISSVNQSLQALKPDELDARVGQVADRIESIVGSIGRSIGEEIAVSKSVASKLEELIHKISAAGSSAPEPEKRRGLWDIFHR